MLQNKVSVQSVIYHLSERLADVATEEELIAAVAEYPKSRGASHVTLVGANAHEDTDELVFFNAPPVDSSEFANVLIPLKVRQNLIGFIHLAWDAPQTFSED